MADLSITSGQVLPGAGAVIQDMISFNAALVAGDVVFKDDETGSAGRADCNAAQADTRTPYGIALNTAAVGQPVRVLRSGRITIGATVTPGTAYFSSSSPGGLCPVGDLTTGMSPTFIGIAVSTTELLVNITPSGVIL